MTKTNPATTTSTTTPMVASAEEEPKKDILTQYLDAQCHVLQLYTELAKKRKLCDDLGKQVLQDDFKEFNLLSVDHTEKFDAMGLHIAMSSYEHTQRRAVIKQELLALPRFKEHLDQLSEEILTKKRKLPRVDLEAFLSDTLSTAMVTVDTAVKDAMDVILNKYADEAVGIRGDDPTIKKAKTTILRTICGPKSTKSPEPTFLERDTILVYEVDHLCKDGKTSELYGAWAFIKNVDYTCHAYGFRKYFTTMDKASCHVEVLSEAMSYAHEHFRKGTDPRHLRVIAVVCLNAAMEKMDIPSAEATLALYAKNSYFRLSTLEQHQVVFRGIPSVRDLGFAGEGYRQITLITPQLLEKAKLNKLIRYQRAPNEVVDHLYIKNNYNHDLIAWEETNRKRNGVVLIEHHPCEKKTEPKEMPKPEHKLIDEVDLVLVYYATFDPKEWKGYGAWMFLDGASYKCYGYGFTTCRQITDMTNETCCVETLADALFYASDNMRFRYVERRRHRQRCAAIYFGKTYDKAKTHSSVYVPCAAESLKVYEKLESKKWGGLVDSDMTFQGVLYEKCIVTGANYVEGMIEKLMEIVQLQQVRRYHSVPSCELGVEHIKTQYQSDLKYWKDNGTIRLHGTAVFEPGNALKKEREDRENAVIELHPEEKKTEPALPKSAPATIDEKDSKPYDMLMMYYVQFDPAKNVQYGCWVSINTATMHCYGYGIRGFTIKTTMKRCCVDTVKDAMNWVHDTIIPTDGRQRCGIICLNEPSPTPNPPPAEQIPLVHECLRNYADMRVDRWSKIANGGLWFDAVATRRVSSSVVDYGIKISKAFISKVKSGSGLYCYTHAPKQVVDVQYVLNRYEQDCNTGLTKVLDEDELIDEAEKMDVEKTTQTATGVTIKPDVKFDIVVLYYVEFDSSVKTGEGSWIILNEKNGHCYGYGFRSFWRPSLESTRTMESCSNDIVKDAMNYVHRKMIKGVLDIIGQVRCAVVSLTLSTLYSQTCASRYVTSVAHCITRFKDTNESTWSDIVGSGMDFLAIPGAKLDIPTYELGNVMTYALVSKAKQHDVGFYNHTANKKVDVVYMMDTYLREKAAVKCLKSVKTDEMGW